MGIILKEGALMAPHEGEKASRIEVLVVDDEEDLSEMAKDMLEMSSDLRVCTASSPMLARDVLAQKQIDVIVSDYQMPRENGIHFLSCLREQGNNIPFILFTGKGREEVVIEAIDKGADSYVQKGGETASVFAELAHKIRGAVGRARAEAALRESEAHYRSLIDGSPVGLLITDCEGNCLRANFTWLEMTKMTLEQASGRGWQALIPPGEAEAVMAEWRASLETEGKRSFEYRISLPSGKDVWLLANASPIASTAGKPATFVMTNIDITSRRRAEEAIRERERTIAKASSLAKVGHWIWRNATGEFILSDGLCVLLGIEPGLTLPHDYFFQMVHPDDRMAVIDALDQTMKRRRTFDLEHRMVRADGRIITVRDTVEVTSTSGNKPVYILGMVQDVTEMRATGEALRESQNLSHTLLEAVAEGIIMLGSDREILAINSEAARILGALSLNTKGTLEAIPVGELVDEQGTPLQEAESPWHVTMDQGAPLSHQILGVRKAGATSWLSLNTRPLFHEGNDLPYAVVISFSDVTERKKAQDLERENERRYRELVDLAPFPVVIAALDDGCILLVNARLEQTLGMERGDAIGRNAADICGGGDWRRLTSAAERDGQVVGMEVAIATEEGAEFWALASATKAQFEGCPAIFMSFVDITGSRLAQEEARAANRKLSLVNDITRHDALNQLTSIQGNLFLLRRRGLTPEQEEIVDRVDNAARNISGQLGFAKLYQDIGLQRPAWQDLESALRTARGSLCTEDMVLEMGQVAYEIWADPMFGRVMLNLMDNALRHGHARRMRVEAKEEMEALLISLEDDGDGIPEAKKDDLFTRSSASSHGYGLFLTREILNMTGIQIRETGSRGRGACFEMMVPPGAWRPIAQ